MSPFEIATNFAVALDADDYTAAARVIHPNCIYTIDEKTIHGCDAIIDSYRSASVTGRALFDSLEYDSYVTMKDDAHAIITFLDVITHAGQVHKHRCEQHLTIENDFVTAIEHCDLPGERDALNSFKRTVSIATS